MYMTTPSDPPRTQFTLDTNSHVDVLHSLIQRATQQRSLHLLAMAFRLKYPRWGSQSVLITMGLAAFLHSIEWKLTQAEYRILDYMDTTDTWQSAQLRGLRLTQIRHLVELVTAQEPYAMRPANNTAQAQQLTLLANQGFLLYELQQLVQEERVAQEYVQLAPLLRGLTLDVYVAAVHPDDRYMHPNVLNEKVVFFKQRILDIANEYAPHHTGYISTGASLRA